MTNNRGRFFSTVLLGFVLLTGCLSAVSNARDYEEIPSMLNVLTNIVQSAVEQGYYEKGEQAVMEYVDKKNPNILKWFTENNYELRLGVVSVYGVVVVCDNGKPIFEDTYCNAGYPDKDHRNNPNLTSCEITMSPDEVKSICQPKKPESLENAR